MKQTRSAMSYTQEVMNQTDLARILDVSKAYISMMLSGKKKPSKTVAEKLRLLGVNLEPIKSEANKPILSHARLPIPTLPHTRTQSTF